MVELFANSGDPHSAASDLDLHCLPITLTGKQTTMGEMKVPEFAYRCTAPNKGLIA